MFPIHDVTFQRQLIAERHEALRRAAGHSHLRREARSIRRRTRPGPAG
ncbi:MAG: hypothetical protein ABIO83_05055 [Ilumatobacteraceae bacterium]